MSHFLLQNIPLYKEFVNSINITYSDECPSQEINKTLYTYLEKIKSGIDKCPKLWEKYKKITNPYEYIHTPIKNNFPPVCSLKPLSRSFFKMIEMSKMLDLMDDLPDKIKTFHLAEGPGGFIEAMCILRKNPNDIYYGMTLQNDIESSVPGWKKK